MKAAHNCLNARLPDAEKCWAIARFLKKSVQNDHLIKKVWWKVGCKVFCCMFFRSGQLILKLIKKIVLIQSRNRMHTDQSILSVIEQPNKCTI